MSKNKYNWPLQRDSYSLWNKLNICKFILTEDKWTQGEWVEKYEQRWSEITKCPYTVMVSSGSTANELIFLRYKWELENKGFFYKKNKIIFPVVNWISSVSPAVNIGFEPVFVDVSLNNLCATVEDIEKILKRDSLRREPEIGAVFYTTLLGFACDIVDLYDLCTRYNVKLYLDNCESSFSMDAKSGINFNNFVTSSTSVYYSHLSSAIEGGIIFCQTEEEYNWYKMMRSHGMTRGMPEKYKNKDVDESFDFALMGSNYRSTNLFAYIGLQVLDRDFEFCKNKRIELVSEFYDDLTFGDEQYHLPHVECNLQSAGEFSYIPFALVVLPKDSTPERAARIRLLLETLNIESRPIVGSHLLHQTAFKKYGKPNNFPNAEYIHKQGRYVGIHSGVTKKMVKQLAEALSNI